MSNTDEFVLYYWPKSFVGPGRGEFIRLLFEETGTAYKEISDQKLLVSLAAAKPSDTDTDIGFPIFAVPVLKHGDIIISQTPVISRYLGKLFGLWPQNEADVWHAEMINTTIHDFIAEGRLVFHGKHFIKSYFDQQEETKPYIKWFVEERFSRWLTYFERALAHNNGGNGFLMGNQLTYVDLALLHVLRAAEAQFPEAWKSLDSIPLLKAFKERISARPNLAAYFKSDRCVPFSGNSMM